MKPVQLVSYPESHGLDKYDGCILVLSQSWFDAAANSRSRSGIAVPVLDAFHTFVKQSQFKFKAGEVASFDLHPGLRVVAACYDASMTMFQCLTLARKSMEPLRAIKAQKVLCELGDPSISASRMADALMSAAAVGEYEHFKYASRRAHADWQLPDLKVKLTFRVPKALHANIGELARHALARAHGTNLVRRLSEMAGNDLTCGRYVKLAQEVAKAKGLTYSFTSLAQLQKLGAGAFVAVAQAAPDSGAGIVKLQYRPKGAIGKDVRGRHLAIVGKGITYDTGGVNLKPAMHMYGMHGDMAGSAITLALMLVAAEEQWAFPVTGYLAIADNMINERAYRPNDVVHSLSGKSIEVIHTDAEGRMILADTLTLACRDGAECILDFATLTGACQGAIGDSYSGVFTNRDDLDAALIEAGRITGERIWPFPRDPDLGKCLDSDIADIKQCRLKGGVDHIEAAHFLSQFVESKVPWVHVDLSAAEHDEGLAHVPTKITGFGVRVGANLAHRLALA